MSAPRSLNADTLRPLFTDVGEYSRVALPRRRLRGYQIEPARAVIESVVEGLGRQFVLLFSRQAGKDETLAQIVAFLLTRYQRAGGAVVVAAPTAKPQAAISRDRAHERLRESPLTARRVELGGDTVRVGQALARYLSAQPGANVRGATADLLLVANEAQDIDPAIWDARFDPMAASTNATTVYMGTSWTKSGLLHRQRRHLEELEARDGERRVFLVPWRRVAEELPAYGERVRARTEQLGADHPYVKTEYELVELDAEGGLFPPARLAQLRGEHPRRRRPEAGKVYAATIDVAGEEEEGAGPAAFDAGSNRDATALTVYEVETAGRELPVYRTVERYGWTGRKFTALYPQLIDLLGTVWRVRALVVDATGVGEVLASFLADRLGRAPYRAAVEAFKFTGKSKSDLGWAYTGMIDAGRVKEYADDGEELTGVFWSELAACEYEVLPGPGKLLRWSVPAGRGHDDLLVSAALVARLDGMDWRPRVARGSDAGDGRGRLPRR